GANAYSIATGTGPNFVLSGPGFVLNEQASANGGVTLKGGTTANTFNLLSTFGAEPVNLFGGSNNDTFNVRALSSAVTVDGNAGPDSAVVGNASNTLSNINGNLTIRDTGGTIAVRLNDSGDATARGVVLTANNNSGAGNVAGLSPAPILFPALGQLAS